MKKNILLYLALSFSFFSACDKDKKNEGGLSECNTNCRAVEQFSSASDPLFGTPDTTQYFYNSEGQIQKSVSTHGVEQIYQWQTDQILVEETENGVFKETMRYILDELGRVVKVESPNGFVQSTYEYNIDGYLVLNLDFEPDGSVDTLRIIWGNGEVKKTIFSNGNIITWEPDESKPFDCSHVVLPIYGKFPRSLVKQKMWKDGSVENHAYTLDGEGKVLQQIITETLGTMSRTFSTRYRYECQ